MTAITITASQALLPSIRIPGISQAATPIAIAAINHRIMSFI